MKYVSLILCAVILSGCGAHNPTNEWYKEKNRMAGSTSYDPETGDWIFIRNEPFGAQRHAKRLGWKWGDPNPPW